MNTDVQHIHGNGLVFQNTDMMGEWDDVQEGVL